MLEKKTSIKFMKWMKVHENDKYRYKQVEKEMPKHEFVVPFLDEITEFRMHVDRVKNQYEQMRFKRENLKEGEVLVWMDFAENFTCSAMDEVQSAYWNQEMVTLHTMVIYFPESYGKAHKSVVAVSDVLHHNATMVYSIINGLIPFIKAEYPNFDTIHYLTDSPTSQYRNKTIFDIICMHRSDFGVSATWNYLEAGHGKGPCDGLGASVKRSAGLAVKQNKAVIQNASDFFSWSLQHMSGSVVSFLFVTEEQYNTSANVLQLRSENLLPVKGTMRVHNVLPVSENEIYTRDKSCCCEDCSRNVELTNCSGWNRHLLKKVTTDNETNAEGNDQQHEQVNDHERNDQSISVKVGDFVSATYEHNWYIGQVLAVDQEESDVHVNFMVKCSKTVNTFKWPSPPDQIWIEMSNILVVIKDPEPSGKSKGIYKVANYDIEKTEEKFENLTR